MIRIDDHLFRPDLIRHVWTETDGQRFVVFIEVEVGETVERWPFWFATRTLSTDMINRVQSEMERLMHGEDEDESYDIV